MLSLREALHFWARPSVGRVSNETGPSAAGGCESSQAESLCDLVADPRSGITRVRVVSGEPALLDAVEAAASRRGLAARGARSAALSRGRLTLQRPAPGAGRGAVPVGAGGSPVRRVAG